MDFRRLQVFVKVYERKSFSRAAEEVLLSQPTVSGHIKSLEDELALRLFDRLGREILPTQGAELLYGHARRILDSVEEATQSMDAFLGRFQGELKLGGSTIPGEYVLPAVLGRFRQAYPQIRATLYISDTGQTASRVLMGELEVGMVGAAWEEDKLSFTPVMQDEVCLAAWPEHALSGRTATLAELARTPLILREPTSGTRMFVNQALQEAGLSPGDLQVVAQMGSTMAVLQGVRARVGAGFLSRRALVEDLAAGRLTEIKVKGLELVRRFYLVTRRDRTHSPAAQAFIDICLAELKGAPA